MNRTECLEALIQYDGPLCEIQQALHSFSWDSDTELVTLTRSHVQQILKRFSSGLLRAADVEEWANAIEGREDISLEAGHEEDLSDAIFVLANPVINGALTIDAADNLIRQLADK